MTSMWDQGCSFKQDAGYETYLRTKSLAPFCYQMSCVAPASCPEAGPKRSQCRGFAPGGQQIPSESTLWQQKLTRGRMNVERRPQTALAGTSAYRGAKEGAMDANVVSTGTALMQGEAARGICRRVLMESPDLSTRMSSLPGFQPVVEAFQPGGLPTRCNKLAYKTNPSNKFIAPAPVPPPLTVMTGQFPPAFQ